jgi:hypothetical protein
MAYVLEYTVTAGGQTEVIEAVTHLDAFHKFVLNPRMKWSNHAGTYNPSEGEDIIVVGYTQEEFTERQSKASIVRIVRDDINKPGRRAAGRPSKADQRERLATLERELAEMVLRQHVVRFKAKLVTVHEAEYVSGLPEELESESERAFI